MPAVLCVFILGPFVIMKMGAAGLMAILSSFLTIPMLTWLGRYTDRQETKIKRHEDSLATLIGEWVSNIRLIRYLGWQKSFRKKSAGIVRQYTIESCIQHMLFILCYGMSCMVAYSHRGHDCYGEGFIHTG